MSWYGANRPEFREALLSSGVPASSIAALPPTDYAGHATDFFAAAGRCSQPASFHESKSLPETTRETVVIHPFSGGRRKNWPLHLYRELASQLPCEVEWTAGPEEELPGAERFANLADLAAWIAGARLYIGNDSGITHLAAAIGVQTLALFGPSVARRHGRRAGKTSQFCAATPIEESRSGDRIERVNRLLGSP